MQEAHFALGGSDWIELPVCIQPVGGVIRVQNCPKECGHVCFLPNVGRSFVSRVSYERAYSAGNQTYEPFPTQVDYISIYSTRDLDVDANIYARERIETTAWFAVNDADKVVTKELTSKNHS